MAVGRTKSDMAVIMKRLLAFLAILWCGSTAFAATPAFTDFNTNQFATVGNKIAIKDGAQFTNSTPTNLFSAQFTRTNGTNINLASGLITTNLQSDNQIRIGTNGVADVFLVREANNTLAQRNGTTAQSNYLYNTFTSDTVYERARLVWAANIFNIGTEKGSGGGSERAIRITSGVTTGNAVSILTAGALRWNFQGEGHLFANIDNTIDIGAVGASRPRTGNFGTSLVAPTGNISSNTAALFPKTNDFVIATRYTNTVAGGFGTQRAIVAASFTLNAAAAGTAKVSLYVEHTTGGLTNKLTISAGPLASLTTTEPLTLPVSPSAIFRFEDETSGTGASVSIVPATSSWFGF